MNANQRWAYAQIGIIAFIWIIIFFSPLAFDIINNNINWEKVFRVWRELSIIFALFLMNRFVLIPFLVPKNKLHYILTIFGLIILMSTALFVFKKSRNPSKRVPFAIERIDPRPPSRHTKKFKPPFINFFITSILLLGFDTGLIFMSKWLQSEQRRVELEKENMTSQLAFLQNQISPHFFLNTLNNIHALIDFDRDVAKNSIIQLSKIMRYLLYDSQVNLIDISHELTCIENYIDLMRLRFSENVKINYSVEDAINGFKIPPLLFISFIENAFKHGISHQEKSYISIAYKRVNGHLLVEIDNSNFSKKVTPSLQTTIDKQSGIGIENAKKRFDLLFNKNYHLDIVDRPDHFFVSVKIPII